MINDIGKPIEDIKQVYIINYLDNLIYHKQQKAGSVNTKKNIFSGFWGWLMTNGYVEKNIVKGISSNKYKSENKEVDIISDDTLVDFMIQLESIKCKFVSVRDIAITKLLLGSGIRISELVGLDLSDISLGGNTPYVDVVPKGTTHNVKRTIISNEARDSILEYLKYRPSVDCDALFLSG